MAALYTELFPKYLDPDLYRVVNGGIPETTKVLTLALLFSNHSFLIIGTHPATYSSWTSSGTTVRASQTLLPLPLDFY